MSSLNFHEKTLTQGLKNIGYTPAEAIADLIDNSIEAKAKNIEIFFWEGTQNPSVFIIDDGEGMNNDELNNALKIKKNYSKSKNKTMIKASMICIFILFFPLKTSGQIFSTFYGSMFFYLFSISYFFSSVQKRFL